MRKININKVFSIVYSKKITLTNMALTYRMKKRG